MANVEYHTGPRGFWGYPAAYTTSTGETRRGALPAVVLTGAGGSDIGTASNPLITAGAGGSGITQAELIAALKSGTATKSAVPSGIASVTILASNANRKGATISNTDANALYLDLSGGTASATSFTVALGAGSTTPTYYEVPFGYTGTITGIWAADGAGSALVTEFV